MRGERCLLKWLVMGTLAVACVLGTFTLDASAEYYVLRSYAGGTDDGAYPSGPLLRDGTTLYGTTGNGGFSNAGTIYKVNTDGTGCEILLNIGEVGYYDIQGGLVLQGSTLYGVIFNNALQYKLFRVNTDGSGFTILYSFTVTPTGYLTFYEDLGISYLYGVTGAGGAEAKGTIFRVRTDGTDFQTLYNFLGGSTDGDKPVGSLTLSGATFYGETLRGGAGNFGTLFKIGANGTLYQSLYHFVGGFSDRAGPNGFLTLSGSKLYGMTAADSTSHPAVIFRINTDGTGFQTLYTFSWDTFWTIDGPYCPLVVVGSTIYGVNPESGSRGTIFRLNTDGSGYQTLHNFTGEPTDGAMPDGFLLLADSTLYGTTLGGGSADLGILYSLTIGDMPFIYPLLLQ
ncbi:MAG: choice-of-anchor tandem repeat GloVer-containing protein [Syntrophobacteraceae bacterium]